MCQQYKWCGKYDVNSSIQICDIQIVNVPKFITWLNRPWLCLVRQWFLSSAQHWSKFQWYIEVLADSFLYPWKFGNWSTISGPKIREKHSGTVSRPRHIRLKQKDGSSWNFVCGHLLRQRIINWLLEDPRRILHMKNYHNPGGATALAEVCTVWALSRLPMK